MARVSVFTKDGFYIGDIRAATNREYILNANPSPGRCEFQVARYDPKNSLKYLEFGNYVLVRQEGLPDWVGIIVNRRWNFGSVEVLALQAEFILDKRNTQIQKITGTAGSLFNQILQRTNSEPFNEKPIKPNLIYTGGTSREETLGKSALEHIKAISERSANDFSINYSFDDNRRLYLVGDWYEIKGVKTERHLREGYNIELTNNILEEDARVMVNYLEGRGDASTSGTRPSSIQWDDESIARYGLWQGSEVFDGNKDAGTIKDNTLNTLKASLDPSRSYDITVVNVDGIYGYLDTGNVLYLDLYTAGYDEVESSVRVLGMEVDDMRGKCRLIVERL